MSRRRPKRVPKHVSPHASKPVPKHVRDGREQLGSAFASLRLTDPRFYAEHLALIESVTKRAEHWRTHEIRLPRGVRVEPMRDEHDRVVYAIDWGRDPPPAPPTFLLDRALAIEAAWTVFMLRRPWAIDDARL